MKKICTILMTVLLLIPIAVSAESVQTGRFRYMPAFEEESEEVYYFSDDYFRTSGTEYNEHLLGMSYALALSTFEIRGAEYCQDLLEETGFSDIEVFDMKEKPTPDTLGMLIGRKKVDGRDLIAVAIRGEKYDSEWSSNLLAGKEGDATGFRQACAKALGRIKGYIDSYGLNDLKIWITGYSRAGAVADLAGVYLNEHLSEFRTSADDLYIYTFETPKASADDSVYDNIYIVRNINDVITELYPEGWGLHTNGKIIEIGETRSLMAYTGLLTVEEHGEIGMNEFYHDLFAWLSDRLSRADYSDHLEEPLSGLIDIYFSKSDTERAALLNFFMEDVKSALLDNEENKNGLINKAWAVMSHNSDYLYQSISDEIVAILDEVKDAASDPVMTDQEYEFLRSAVYPLLRVLGPVVIDDSNYFEGIDYDRYYREQAEDYYLTDEEMGEKYGKLSGFSNGYDAGFEGDVYDAEPDESESEYGPDYLKAYRLYYGPAYAEGYALGDEHLHDLAAKGTYDGGMHSYNEGYYAGNHGEDFVPYDEYFYREDWMTDEYVEAYDAEYERQYTQGYLDGSSVPEETDEMNEPLGMYHLATLFKNAEDILKMHYPQTNLELIQELDSYYAPYGLIEGDGQIIEIGDDKADQLTVKTGGHLEKLIKVQVDNIDLADGDYELRSGSTIVILKDRYLKTLSVGTHTLKLIYIDNIVQTDFVIRSSKNDRKDHERYRIPVTGID